MQTSSIDTGSRVIIRTLAALRAGILYILHQGGTSSGKTFGILYALLFYALSEMKAGSVISIVAQTLPHLKKGAIVDFKKILGLTGIISHVIENKSDHVFILPNNTRFEFYAPDDEEKAKSGKRDLLFINEANSVSYAIANQLMMRTSGPIILDWNPSGKFWLHRMLLPFIQAAEYVFTRTTYRDNKVVSEKIIRKLEQMKLSSPSDYDIYALGIEGKGTEIIFPNYELVDALPGFGKRGSGLDFGFTNHPSAGVIVEYYDGALWFDEMFYKKGLSNKLIYQEFKMCDDEYGEVIADSAEPKSIAELNELGLNVKGALKGPDSIKFGIDKIKEYPMKVTRRSLNFIDEADSYKWVMKDGVPKKDVPVDKDNHLMDAARYGVQAIFAPVSSVIVKVQKAKRMGFSSIDL